MTTEVDAVALAPRTKHFVIATGVVDQDRTTTQDRLGLVLTRLDRTAACHHRPDSRQPEDEGVEQDVDRLVLASLAPPSGQQHRDVGWELAAGVVAHHQEGPLLGNPLETRHVRAEVRRVPLEQRPGGAQERRVAGRADPSGPRQRSAGHNGAGVSRSV